MTVYGCISNFFRHVFKGRLFCDFLFAYLEDESLTKREVNSSLYEMTPIYMGGTNENGRVASPESVTHSPKDVQNFRNLSAFPQN